MTMEIDKKPVPEYLEMVIHAARRQRLVTYESARQTFDRHARRGLRGTRALRAVLDQWDPTAAATESEMETRLLHAMPAHGLPDPVVQFEVRDRSDHLIARVDAAYPDARIAIEYDSKQEHSDEFQLARDARRRNALAAVGFVTISVRHGDLNRGGDDFCRHIKRILRERRQPA